LWCPTMKCYGVIGDTSVYLCDADGSTVEACRWLAYQLHTLYRNESRVSGVSPHAIFAVADTCPPRLLAYLLYKHARGEHPEILDEYTVHSIHISRERRATQTSKPDRSETDCI